MVDFPTMLEERFKEGMATALYRISKENQYPKKIFSALLQEMFPTIQESERWFLEFYPDSEFEPIKEAWVKND